MKSAPQCSCGCRNPARWLVSGNDYDPRKPNGLGDRYVAEPMCDEAAAWCAENSEALGFPFEKIPLPTDALL